MPDLAEPELGLDRGACGQTLHGVLKRAHGGAGGRDQFPVQLCFLRFAPAVLDGESGCCQVNLSRSEKPEAGCGIKLPPLHSRHSLAASARKIRSVDRETRWR